jgi:3-methylcrotonyl-CoA carboxylase alpha subunit
MEIKKLLIANRGEIALRIIRSAHKLGISAVALTTKAETTAQHARLADEVIEIGDGPSKDSYLSIEKIINASIKTGAQAIHPGYGFLSQSTDFVKTAEENGIIFVGPSTSAMQKMGSKSWSKRIMSESGVPVITGYHGDNQDPEFLFEKAKEVGFPVMIKATMGGGGKGMRLSTEPSNFHANLTSAKNEARGAFGDDEVIIEKFVVDPKHIEIQIIGDNYGNVIHLFERDCSIQRRHQKIIEEGPSTVAPEIIKEIRAMGVRAAQSVGYSNAGTVEFLYEHRTGKFFFMEMNTRLQVEHPVSEMITGVDIVELQLKVAGGMSLKDFKKPEQPLGHAIEARICAEDPYNSFLPTTGKIDTFEFDNKRVKDSSRTMKFDLTHNHSDVRLDTFLIEGSEITPYYDSMIGKLIVFGKDRTEAVSLLESSLKKLKIGGVQTNIPFLLNLMKQKGFLKFDYSLEYFEKNQDVLLKEPVVNYNHMAVFLGVDKLFPRDFTASEGSLFNMRNNNLIRKLYRFHIEKAYSLSGESKNVVVQISQSVVGSAHFKVDVTIDSEHVQSHHIEFVSKQNDSITLKIGNQLFTQKFYGTNDHRLFYHEGIFFKVRDTTLDSVTKALKDSASNLVRSPMPGTITAINCEVGEVIKKGSPIVTIEAMKMEHKVLAATDVKILKVNYSVKDFVEMGATVVETEPAN